jgi:transmembrane sensor
VQHKIKFQQRPLGEVADEFNRYSRIPFEIEGASLRALRISGVFDSHDVESFIEFLGTLPEVRVERTPTRIRVLRVSAAN